MPAETAAAPIGVYRLTSIARPVDPAYPTNKALLILLPAGAAVFALAAYAGLLSLAPFSAALAALLTGFAAWALTRELAPDDNAAAFLALALAWLMSILTDATSVLVMFVSLFLVRIVNRSTGLPAHPWDSILVLVFALWAAYSVNQPLLVLIAALAFAADAVLAGGLRRHWVAAALCCAAVAWWAYSSVILFNVVGEWFVPGAVLFACAIVITFTPRPVSVDDATGAKLAMTRVKTGLGIGALIGAQSLFHGQAWTDNLVWACLAAVPMSAAARRLIG